MSLLGFIAIVSMQASADVSITLGEARRLAPSELAERVLPTEIAREIVGGGFRRIWMPGQVYRAFFWGQSVPDGNLLCRRVVHYVTIGNVTVDGEPERPETVLTLTERGQQAQIGTTYPNVASLETCAHANGYVPDTPNRYGSTRAAIEQLIAAMTAAAGPGPLPFNIRCEPDEVQGSCADPRSALASLPLDVMFGVAFETDNYISRTSAPSVPGARPVVIREMVPRTDGRPAIPTVEFSMSEPDGRSWRVTLVSDGNRLAEVRMTRVFAVYH